MHPSTGSMDKDSLSGLDMGSAKHILKKLSLAFTWIA